MLTFCNVFGKIPTKNFDAAGYDFYIPNIDDTNTELLNEKVIPAFMQTYKLSEEQLRQICGLIQIIGEDRYFADDDDDCKYLYEMYKNILNDNKWNCCHLLLAMSFKSNLPVIDDRGVPLSYNITKFVYDNLIFDVENSLVGVVLHKGDSLFVNSGVKEKLPTGYAGVFFNKSGRATSGYDVGSCVVDEDYTGYVCMNVCFRGSRLSNSEIYCGDKFLQQLILPLYKKETKEVSEDEFEYLTHNSERGDAGFGSSNETH